MNRILYFIYDSVTGFLYKSILFAQYPMSRDKFSDLHCIHIFMT